MHLKQLAELLELPGLAHRDNVQSGQIIPKQVSLVSVWL
jgi:hypothetical protein